MSTTPSSRAGRVKLAAAVVLAAAACACMPALGQDQPTSRPLKATYEQMKGEEPKAANITVLGHIVEPKLVPADAENLARLTLPRGFKIAKWSEAVKHPRMIAVAGDGTVYVSSRDEGHCVMLRDADGDGTPDAEPKVVAEKPNLHGLAVSPDGKTLYLTTIKEIYRAPIQPDGTLGDLQELYRDLPDAGQHPNRTIAFGPDGKLYISVGSTANAADEKNPENATILRAEPDGSDRRIFASGLRNTIGFGWHPATGEMYGADHGIDWLGDDEEPEEFNRIEQGKFYGWPWIYADGRYNPQDDPPAGKTMAEIAAGAAEPVLVYTAHSAPLQMAFYTGSMFPDEYKNDAFIAMRGSWNRLPPSGYEVVRVHFDQSGKPTSMTPFLTGFLIPSGEDRWSQFARLAGLAQLPDGSLLLGDDTNSVIYRITYDGPTARAGE